ncbi:protein MICRORCHIDIA 6 isoform X2 [Amborella trichopoda]|nr:protein MICRORCHIDIA 6 isoform X2 [Amborella trichopoda]XP_020520823.1 protein MICRORCHIDIA 6 isoform X2 [Amborella trichopoda]XP_020520824.1 protein MICRORCHIDIA 6 isoform X2 [Amborella trichopoda]|eukprot:XP_020520822.1 protein MICRORCHIDIA 6 isoform X2 [Amborella trichopoda]
MGSPMVVDLSSDDDNGEAEVKGVILEFPSVLKAPDNSLAENVQQENVEQVGRNDHKEEITPAGPPNSEEINQSNLEKRNPALDMNLIASGSSQSICRQFWKAGDYPEGPPTKEVVRESMDHLRVHPKFLHSNATSHKWALGAIAELLDNAVDEINNGATFVNIDKVVNPRDGAAALLIQDDGGGMGPECMRQCMSLGYSQKQSTSTIGQYGNGFKTSTMRLGADVIVFSRWTNKRVQNIRCSSPTLALRACSLSLEFKTESIGLLSYTFLKETCQDDIVVPMVDYEILPSTGERRKLLRSRQEDWSFNLSTILKWSPYSTEEDLLKQLDDVGPHGTKIVVYNLWLNDVGELELDFDSDKEDIRIHGASKVAESGTLPDKQTEHVANRFRYSLRVYSSILYQHLPNSFTILLRGRAVEQHRIVDDLKFPQYILYKPQSGGNREVSVITTIGFMRDAPKVNIHGFNVYHKNRLILPFWRVVNEHGGNKGRGVVGVLEANFIKPAHDKQDFERTSVLQKLETRLKQMTIEYWNLHCGLIGYHRVQKSRSKMVQSTRTIIGSLESVTNCTSTLLDTAPLRSTQAPPASQRNHIVSSPREENIWGLQHGVGQPVVMACAAPSASNCTDSRLIAKRKVGDGLVGPESSKRQAVDAGDDGGSSNDHDIELCDVAEDQMHSQEVQELMKESKKLKALCLEYEQQGEELEHTVQQLEHELQEVQREYARLLIESQSVSIVKEEKD